MHAVPRGQPTAAISMREDVLVPWVRSCFRIAPRHRLLLTPGIHFKVPAGAPQVEVLATGSMVPVACFLDCPALLIERQLPSSKSNRPSLFTSDPSRSTKNAIFPRGVAVPDPWFRADGGSCPFGTLQHEKGKTVHAEGSRSLHRVQPAAGRERHDPQHRWDILGSPSRLSRATRRRDDVPKIDTSANPGRPLHWRGGRGKWYRVRRWIA
jgi:hypothetical protein